MPFRISLSGLDATSSALDVVANNIANSNTTGFKTSRVNFADVYATGSLNLSSLQSGEGVTIAGIQQQFTQGNITQTGNNLDMAISGQGFFTLHDASGYYYTRNGTFSVDRTGYVVNAQSQRLQVYPALPNGQFNTGALQDLQLNTSQSAPQATAAVAANVNLPANATAPVDAPFNPTDPLSYTNTTSTAVYSVEPVVLEERRAWLAARRERSFPVLVAVDGGEVLGFASFGDWRGNWAGYRYTVEHTVHVRANVRRRGVGRELVEALIPRARDLGKHVMIGSIDATNLDSLLFHQRLGFERVAHFREVGRKFGRWLDLVFMQRWLDTPGAQRLD